MPLFKEIATKILSALEELPNGQCEILFGDAERFKAWLKEQEVEEEVSVYLKVLIKIINYKQ